MPIPTKLVAICRGLLYSHVIYVHMIVMKYYNILYNLAHRVGERDLFYILVFLF